MAIDFVPALYEKEVQRLMPTYGSLFANGLIFNDSAPTFANGGNFYYSRYLKSIATLGEDNRRADSGDISAKELTDGELKGVIIRRYDAIEQKNLDVIVSGVDGLKQITPQIAEANTANIERRFADILFGLFRYGGALRSTHSYDYAVLSGTNYMDEIAIINAQTLMGRYSNQLTKIILHSSQYANMLKNGLVDYTTMSQGQEVANTGQMGAFAGKKFIVDDDLCAALPAATLGTVTLSSGAVSAIAVTDGGEGYSSAPTVTITGNGTGATATAVLTGGRVTSITIGAGGSGYSGTVTATVAAPATYPAFLVGGQPFYLGYQRNMQMELIRNATKQNITQTLRWDLDYCPHVINTNYDSSTANPTATELKTAASWTSKADNVQDIKIIRCLTK